MKGVRFYEEYANKSKTQSKGSVVAALVDNGVYFSTSYNKQGQPINVACYEATSGVYDRPDSPVASGGVSLGYLSQYCKHISESRAREIHPQLFVYLDQ